MIVSPVNRLERTPAEKDLVFQIATGPVYAVGQDDMGVRRGQRLLL